MTLEESLSKNKLCPICGLKGSGPHYRNVPVKGKVYRYPYFAHYVSKGKIKWCYLPKKLLER